MARRQAKDASSKAAIIDAAVSVFRTRPPAAWTVDLVAGEARCAKGLVLYHFKTKAALLLQVAGRVREQHLASRVSGFEAARGAAALDRLWSALSDEVKSGSFGLWVQMLSDGRTRQGAARTDDDDRVAIQAAGKALDIAGDSIALGLMPAALDGLALELLQGHDAALVRERYDAFWLGVLSDAV